MLTMGKNQRLRRVMMRRPRKSVKKAARSHVRTNVLEQSCR
jgi:hypothetical protein